MKIVFYPHPVVIHLFIAFVGMLHFDVMEHLESKSYLNPDVWINKYRPGWSAPCFSASSVWMCIFIDTLGDKSWCCYRQKSWGLACRIWRSSWLTLIAEVDLGSSTICWSITWPGFRSMSTRERIVYPMLWRIFWQSKVPAARSQDDSTWPVIPVAYVVMSRDTSRHCNNLPYQCSQDLQAWIRNLTSATPSAVQMHHCCVSVSSVWHCCRYDTTKLLNQEAGNNAGNNTSPNYQTQC